MKVAHLVQELRELGFSGALYRTRREVRHRLGIEALLERRGSLAESTVGSARFDDDLLMGAWAARRLFAAPADVAPFRERQSEDQLTALRDQARRATRGTIRCFGRWDADFGHPIDWHLNPLNGLRWDPTLHWSRALRDGATVGEVKFAWEVGRFPQAFALARAATFDLCPSAQMAAALDQQIRSFVSNNPFPLGVHWNSGQEIALRLISLIFAVGAFAQLGVDQGSLPAFVARGALTMAQHLESQLEFAQRAIYNNHLLSEALGLILAGWMLPPCEATARWARVGYAVLDEQADRQVYRDGAYIQLSHNYHRVAMQVYLAASCVSRAQGRPVSATWSRAMEASLHFLVAHQNPDDGRLPNFGANDGAMPLALTACDFSDFRPVLQALSVATRGERMYETGPWDEEAAWLMGREAVGEAPLRLPTRCSVAFRDTGFYVLRGRQPASFAAFRCGTVRDRFAQIDMLHLDVWWRGQNVLVDPGSYCYNGTDDSHSHFVRTESHNTVQVDGNDQMLHYRQFKNLYWTPAKVRGFEDHDGFALCTGEHDGFRRNEGGCAHQRSVLFVKDDLWVVVDRISGAGRHDVRLHWLGGDHPNEYQPERGRMTLRTPAGPFSVTVLSETGEPLRGDVVAGQDAPTRGWLSRYYAERVPVPSLAVQRSGVVPLVIVSVLAGGIPRVAVRDGEWSVEAVVDGRANACVFRLEEGMIVPSRVLSGHEPGS